MADAISPCHHQYVLATDEQTNKQTNRRTRPSCGSLCVGGLTKSIFKPRPLLKTQTPPSRPSCILLWRSTGLLSVFIQTPAIALSKISLFSITPRPLLYTRIPPFCPPQILLLRTSGLLPVLYKTQHILYIIPGYFLQNGTLRIK